MGQFTVRSPSSSHGRITKERVRFRANEETGFGALQEALKERKRDALFLGGALRDGGMFVELREMIIKTVKVFWST